MSETTSTIEDLELNTAKIIKNREDWHRLTEYRARLLKELRDNGTTWQTLQDISGLSPRGLKLALDRASSK